MLINYNHSYVAPELWDSKPQTKKSDMWSFGCLMYKILNLKLPVGLSDTLVFFILFKITSFQFEGNNDIELFEKIKR